MATSTRPTWPAVVDRPRLGPSRFRRALDHMERSELIGDLDRSPAHSAESYLHALPGWLIEGLLGDPETWRHPVLRPQVPDAEALTLRLRRLWRSRHSLLAALERGPRVVCHGDLNLTNIYFLRTSLRKPVLIDWQFVGEGAPGEDAGDLFCAASGASHETGIVLDDRDAADLDHLMFDSYISGLREGGWSGPWQQARLGYCLRYVVSMPFALLPVAWLLLPRAGRLVWPPPADLIGPVAHSCLALHRILDLGDEALSLLPATA